MPKPQFSTRQNWRTCPECFGRSFSDPLKEFHYKDCPKYKAWRFGRPGGVVGAASRSGQPRVTRPSDVQQLIEDKVRDGLLEDAEQRAYENYSDREEFFNEQWREVHGEVPW